MRKIYLFNFLIIILVGFYFSACNSSQTGSTKPSLKDTTAVFPTDSFAFYENILVKDSLNNELRLVLATNYYVEKQFGKAVDHLLTIYRFDEKNLEALITLGNIYYDTEQNEKAIAFYEKALLIDNKNVNVRCDMATCYLNLKKTEQALSLLKKNIEIEYNHAQSHHNLSVIYKELGKSIEAAEEMKIYNKLSK